MEIATWNDDYVDAFNAITALMHGSTSRDKIALTATIMTGFKRLVDYMIRQQSKTTIAMAEPQYNPFDIAEKSYGHRRT